MCTGAPQSMLLSVLLLHTRVSSETVLKTACCHTVVATYQNLPYCKDHYVLSLINARRHKCQSCFLFNVVVIRTTPHDQDHWDIIEQKLHVPLWQKGMTDQLDQEYTVQRYCAPDMMERINKNHEIVAEYLSHERIANGIPKNSVVYVDKDRNSEVVAWVHMLRLMQDGTWAPVNMNQYDQMNRVFLSRRTLCAMRQHGYTMDKTPPLCMNG